MNDQRIYRHPAALRVVRGQPSGRKLTPPQVAEWLAKARQQILTRPAFPLGRPAPTRRALLVILENGGILRNVDSDLLQRLNVDITTATCGDWEFRLREGESILDLVARIAVQLMGNLACADWHRWKTQVFNPLDWLNQRTDDWLEDFVKADNSLLHTTARYDTVRIMEDEHARVEPVLTAIRYLAPDHVLDIHVLTHGGRNHFVGYDGEIFEKTRFFDVLQQEGRSGRLPLHLRTVYQMNCESGTLKDEWMALGADAVNGTRREELNNMPHQYFHFLRHWLEGTGMRDATSRAFREAAEYTRPIYDLIGRGGQVDTSELTVSGPAPDTVITSPAQMSGFAPAH